MIWRIVEFGGRLLWQGYAKSSEHALGKWLSLKRHLFIHPKVLRIDKGPLPSVTTEYLSKDGEWKLCSEGGNYIVYDTCVPADLLIDPESQEYVRTAHWYLHDTRLKQNHE